MPFNLDPSEEPFSETVQTKELEKLQCQLSTIKLLAKQNPDDLLFNSCCYLELKESQNFFAKILFDIKNKK